MITGHPILFRLAAIFARLSWFRLPYTVLFFLFFYLHLQPFYYKTSGEGFHFPICQGKRQNMPGFLSLVPFSFLLLHCNFSFYLFARFIYIVLVLSFSSSLFLSFRIIYFCFFSLGIKFLQVSLCALSVGLIMQTVFPWRRVRHPSKSECLGQDNKRHLMVRLQFWRSGECGASLHYHYSHVHLHPEW